MDTLIPTNIPNSILPEKDIVLVTTTEVGSVSSAESISGDDSSSTRASSESDSDATGNAEVHADSYQGTQGTHGEAAVVTALKVLQIIESYGVSFERTGAWEALAGFMPVVTEQIRNNEPVRLLLPGFSFKSPNLKKVLGVLPDLGEELALAHLDGLCKNIDTVYTRGAEVYICSDGLVYNGWYLSPISFSHLLLPCVSLIPTSTER